MPWDALKDLATDQGVTIGCAESLTGGLLGGYISRSSGASAYYVGTLCAYNIDTKVSILRVPRHMAEKCDCVSPDVAREMARGACFIFGCDIGVSTTGYAEANPTGGVDYPYAYWCIVRRGEVLAEGKVDHPLDWENHSRSEVQKLVAMHVLGALVDVLTLSS